MFRAMDMTQLYAASANNEDVYLKPSASAALGYDHATNFQVSEVHHTAVGLTNKQGFMTSFNYFNNHDVTTVALDHAQAIEMNKTVNRSRAMTESWAERKAEAIASRPLRLVS